MSSPDYRALCAEFIHYYHAGFLIPCPGWEEIAGYPPLIEHIRTTCAALAQPAPKPPTRRRQENEQPWLMTELSPAAQAVLDATGASEPGIYATIAAALRAVADQVVPELGRPRTADERTLYHEGRLDALIRHRDQIIAIAAELETK